MKSIDTEVRPTSFKGQLETSVQDCIPKSTSNIVANELPPGDLFQDLGHDSKWIVSTVKHDKQCCNRKEVGGWHTAPHCGPCPQAKRSSHAYRHTQKCLSYQTYPTCTLYHPRQQLSNVKCREWAWWYWSQSGMPCHLVVPLYFHHHYHHDCD